MMNNKETKKVLPERTEGIARKNRGFESLVVKELYDKVKELDIVLRELTDVHAKHMDNHPFNLNTTNTYQRIQFLLFCEALQKMVKEFAFLLHIHEVDKEFIDEVVKEENLPNLEALEIHLMFQGMLDSMK